MHELGLTQEIVAIVSERAAGARVCRIVVEIGQLAAILPDAIEFCFEACAEGTSAEGAELVFVLVPGRGRCTACDAEVMLDHPLRRCACGRGDVEWLSGDGLAIREMELEVT